MSERIKIGEMMLKAGLIDQLQLNAGLAHQRKWGGKLGSVLVELGFVDEDMLWKGLARQTGLPRAELATLRVNPTLLQRIPLDVLERHLIFPVGYREDTRILTVATADPASSEGLNELTFRTRLKTAPALAPEAEIAWAIRHHYKNEASACPPLRKKKQVAMEVESEEFKLTDMNGNTVMKAITDILPPSAPRATSPHAVPMGAPTMGASMGAQPMGTPRSSPGNAIPFGTPPSSPANPMPFGAPGSSVFGAPGSSVFGAPGSSVFGAPGSSVFGAQPGFSPPAPQGVPRSSSGNALPFGNPGSVVAAAPSPDVAALKAEIDKGNRFLKTVLELCIARGVFTQEEYFERLRRQG